jgi:D-alanyl-D-alanine carboxypeptidase (penicillin-binding protein 5/6)
MSRFKKISTLLILIILIAVYSSWALLRPISPIKAAINSDVLKPTTLASTIDWPSAGQSAVGILGTPIINTHFDQTPTPTASTAKLVAALVILKIKPLGTNDQGPEITMTPADVDLYNSYVNEQGSVVRVVNGEQISEYQLLEGMLLPSANNMADSLAIWAYGSLSNYSVAANSYLKSVGIDNTVIGTDASGFLPSTTSTASDLVKIGSIVANNPVLSGIVSQKSVDNFPVVGSIKNINTLLGSNGVSGIKTGNSDQAGGVFISSSTINVDDRNITIITANAASPSLDQVLSSSLPLIQSAQADIGTTTSLTKGTVIGSYTLPWNKKTINIELDSSLSGIVWQNGSLSPAIEQLDKLNGLSRWNQVVGSVSLEGSSVISANTANLVISGYSQKPPIIWRLLHP